MIRLAIFDCDGTLVDSGGNIHAALAETFGRRGLPIPPARSSERVIGLSLVEAMAALLPDADARMHAALAEEYKTNFAQMRLAGQIAEPLYDGVLALLDRLEADGWLLAVATGKSERGLRHCLNAHGIHARFVSLQTADGHPSKPHPSMAVQAMADAGAVPANTIVIGDTSFDMGMARAAGAAGIGAAWGYHDPADLTSAGATAIAETPAEVAVIAATLVRQIA